MITTYNQALKIQVNRAKQNKPGLAKAVVRYLKREGKDNAIVKRRLLREAEQIANPVEEVA